MRRSEVGRTGRRLLACALLALTAVAAACSGPSEGAPPPSSPTSPPAVEAGNTEAPATSPAAPPGVASPRLDDCDGVAALAFARIEVLLVTLEGAVDADETLDGLLLRLVSEQPLAAELEPLLALGPGRPFAGLGGDDVQQAYAGHDCNVEDEYPAIDAWLLGRYGAAHPALAAGGRDVLVDDVLPSIEAAGEALVVATLANRRYHAGPPDGGTASALVEVLVAAVEAQEAHRVATGAYARVEGDLAPFGFDAGRLLADEDYFFIIWEADDAAYCMSVSRQGSAYVESHDATPTVEDRREPCPNTFPD